MHTNRCIEERNNIFLFHFLPLTDAVRPVLHQFLQLVLYKFTCPSHGILRPGTQPKPHNNTGAQPEFCTALISCDNDVTLEVALQNIFCLFEKKTFLLQRE